MIDRGKVIRHIVAEISIAKTCKKDFASVDIDMLSDALELLKEQEPRKAEYVGRNGVMSWECPQCKNLLDMFCNGEFVNYCWYCGQKVVF